MKPSKRIEEIASRVSNWGLLSPSERRQARISAIIQYLDESQEPKALEEKCPNFGKFNCICPRCYKESKPQDEPKECCTCPKPRNGVTSCPCSCHQESETDRQVYVYLTNHIIEEDGCENVGTFSRNKVLKNLEK